MVLTADIARTENDSASGQDSLAGRGRPHESASVSLPARAESIGVARRWARSELDSMPVSVEVRERTVLLISELATNVVQHTASARFTVRFCPGTVLRVEVRDRDPQLPAPRTAAWCDVGGRGLHLVEALSDRWGAHRTKRGKCVWAEIDRAGGRSGRTG